MPYYKFKNNFLFLFILLVACQNTNKKQVVEEVKFDTKKIEMEGAKITAQSFSTLSSHLQHQMKTNGIENAIGFCKINANPIVDSLSKFYQVDIKRTSLKLRNEANKANEIEMSVLKNYQAAFDSGKDIENHVYNENGETYFFAPIYTMDACTKCHGKANETLNELAHAKLNKLYPNDKATGYNAGDLRGIWSVKF